MLQSKTVKLRKINRINRLIFSKLILAFNGLLIKLY